MKVLPHAGMVGERIKLDSFFVCVVCWCDRLILLANMCVRLRKKRGVILVFMVLMSCLENVQAGNSQPSVVVQQVDGKPVIDGVLNEEEWMRAKKIQNFGQVEPREGKEASERTEVLLMRTDEALYLGVRCFDRTPAKVLARDRRRDSTGSGDDRLRIVIDPFARGTEGYFFGIAAGGGERGWGRARGASSRDGVGLYLGCQDAGHCRGLGSGD